MKKKKSILQKIYKKKKGYIAVDYTLTAKDKKRLMLFVLSASVPIFIVLLIIILN